MSDHERTFSAVVITGMLVLFSVLMLAVTTCNERRIAQSEADWHYENLSGQLDRVERACRAD